MVSGAGKQGGFLVGWEGGIPAPDKIFKFQIVYLLFRFNY